VRDIKNNAGFVATICSNDDAWVVTRPQDAERLADLARSKRRTADVVMQTPSPAHARVALLHIAGPACARD
jgi:cytochrome P450